MLKHKRIPASAKRVPLRPLALGEKTGHHHSLYANGVALEDAAQMYELDTKDGVATFLRITGDGISIQHQEHKTHAIVPGDYQVIIQREETDWGSRPVID